MKDVSNRFMEQFRVFLSLTKRHILVFFKNWTTVLFTMMVPVIILVVYVLFLRQMEINTINPIIEEVVSNPSKELMRKVYALADSWMISGVLAVSCITVSLNTNSIMVRDKERGISKDFLSSPISSRMVMYSYFSFNTLITFVVNFIVLCLCLLFLVCYGALMISVLDFFALIGILLLSTMNASFLTFFICSFINRESTLSAMLAIFSAAIGFLIGAYFPVSILPDGIEYLTSFFPGTYSASLFRNYMMSGPMEALAQELIDMGVNAEEILGNLSETFSFDVSFFQWSIPQELQAWILGLFTVLFGGICLLFSYHNFMKLPRLAKKRKKASSQ